VKSPGDDLSPADLAALRVLTDVAITNNKMVVELARTVARQRGIELPPPRSEQPRRRGKWQYSKLSHKTGQALLRLRLCAIAPAR
jgi:hypothetical protein